MKLTETLSAWVTIDGKRAEEYGVEISEEGRNASCWIASEVGKTFEIYVEDLPLGPSSYRLKIDGTQQRGLAVKSKPDKKRWWTWRGREISPTEIRPFVFSPIQISDDDTLLNNVDFQWQDLGTIVLYGGRCDVQEDAQYQYRDIAAVHSVHERMKKGIDHQITFGTPQAFASTGSSVRTRITGGEFSFVFKYRPLALLQANGIAPCEPCQELPNPNVAKECNVNAQEDSSSSDDEEIFRLKTRKRKLELEQIEDELRRHAKRKSKRHNQPCDVKRESAQPNATGPCTKKIKPENIPTKAIMDVIDLTSD